MEQKPLSALSSHRMNSKSQILVRNRRVAGWREWVALPELGINSIKAKLDTGAKTSALHAWDQKLFERDGRTWVRFNAHPLQRNDEIVLACQAPLTDSRLVTNSGGTGEMRNVIQTSLEVGGESWPIELTLTNRDEMGFRLLIGRQAMRGHFVVDPKFSFRLGVRL